MNAEYLPKNEIERMFIKALWGIRGKIKDKKEVKENGNK